MMPFPISLIQNLSHQELTDDDARELRSAQTYHFVCAQRQCSLVHNISTRKQSEPLSQEGDGS